MPECCPAISAGNGKVIALTVNDLSLEDSTLMRIGAPVVNVSPGDVFLCLVQDDALHWSIRAKGFVSYCTDQANEKGVASAWLVAKPRLHEALERGRTVFLLYADPDEDRALRVAHQLLLDRGVSEKQILQRGIYVPAYSSEVVLSGKQRALLASLMGGAIGDSLGAEIEFMSSDQILASFPGGLTDLPVHDGLRGAITDDKQMSLFTLEGLVRSQKALSSGDVEAVLIEVQMALLRPHDHGVS